MKLNIKIDEQNFAVEVGDLNKRPVRVLVDGEVFEVWPEPEVVKGLALVDLTPVEPVSPPAFLSQTGIPQVPANSAAAGSGKAVLAPIPGVIISVAVKPGDAVVFGQELCVLEAMKMKNLIRANRAGTISAVRVAAGDSVKHSQVLFEYSD
jgi:biotin carboxyl carrier protein